MTSEENHGEESTTVEGPPQERVHASVPEGIPSSIRGTEGEVGATVHSRGATGSGCISQGKRDRTAGHVYLIGVLEGCHKIGKSNNVNRRIPEFGAKLPVVLRVVHAIPTADMVWLESYLHMAFRHRRVRGEWFRLSEEEIGVIAAVCAADSDDDLPPALIALKKQNWTLIYQSKTRPDHYRSQPQQINIRTSPETERLLSDLAPVVAKVLGVMAVSKSELFRQGLLELARKHLPQTTEKTN